MDFVQIVVVHVVDTPGVTVVQSLTQHKNQKNSLKASIVLSHISLESLLSFSSSSFPFFLMELLTGSLHMSSFRSISSFFSIGL